VIRLLALLKPYRGSIAIILTLAFLQSVANLYLPTLMADIVNNGIVKSNIGYIVRAGGLMVLVTLGGAVCAVVGSFFASQVAIGFGRILRGRIFKHVEQFSLHEFDRFSTASLITRTTNDTTQIQQVWTMIFNMVITAPMMAIGGIILALGQDRALTLILVVVMPLVAIIFTLIIRQAIPLFQIIQVKLDRLNLVLDEGLTGVRVIRAFDRNASQNRRFDLANLDVTNTAITVNRIVALLMPSLMLTLNLTSIAILWFGAIRVDQGQMQIGAVLAFLQYAMQILFAVLMVSVMFVMLPRAAASADRINQVLDQPPEIRDPETPATAEAEHGYVEFQEVTFWYPGGEEPALSGISFSARPGEVTAIIGGTGSGKSTLVNLIPRFYDVSQGRILVDGVDVREMTQAELRAKIGFVPQRPVLFSGTIAENIRYGKADATEPEVEHAAEVAQASEFVAQMAAGYDAVIAQGGTNVSGGQKQRLSIARALVRKTEIYVFDDSFSALDFRTDARLRAALKRETTGATVFIVSQRVGTVMDADRILVLDEGRLVGNGTHRALLATCAVYREIVESQLSPEEVA
jgi:ATP-binding cassette subfamily B multidrug efflux pump